MASFILVATLSVGAVMMLEMGVDFLVKKNPPSAIPEGPKVNNVDTL